jgi:Tol biopolymer transport system component
MAMLFLVLSLLSAPEVPLPGSIAFLRGDDPESRRVCVLDLTSGTVTPVGPGRADGPPVWSADGAWLAFESQRTEGGTGIYVARADGSEGRMLDIPVLQARHPSWPPLPRKREESYRHRLAFSGSDGDPATERVYLHDLESGTTAVWGGGHAPLFAPVWLGQSRLVLALQVHLEQTGGPLADMLDLVDARSDSNLLAIGAAESGGGLTTEVLLVAEKGVVPMPTVILPSEGIYEEWNVRPSPNGRDVAFESNDGGDREIYIISHKPAVNVSNHHAADWNPVWSPGGDWLVFESFRGGRRGVWLVNPGTALVTPVAASEDADYWGPTWSPDGRQVAWAREDGDGRPALGVSPWRGGEQRMLDTGPEAAIAPAWRPEPRP